MLKAKGDRGNRGLIMLTRLCQYIAQQGIKRIGRGQYCLDLERIGILGDT